LLLLHVITELTERPFELLGSQSERDRRQEIQIDSQDTAESQDTADSQTKSGPVAYFVVLQHWSADVFESRAEVYSSTSAV